MKGQVEERLKEKARRSQGILTKHAERMPTQIVALQPVFIFSMLDAKICVLYVSPCCFCQVKANEEKVVVRVLNLQEVSSGVI